MGHEGNPVIDRSPEHLLSLPLIPPHIYRRERDKLNIGPISEEQRRAIRCILRMRDRVPFDRCKGRVARKVRRFEEAGDFSHSGKGHLCDACQCRQKAGSGTKGNFYGLGPETGTLGVGLCRSCLMQPKHFHGIGLMLQNARREVEMKQAYGTASQDSEYALVVAKEEAALAVRTEKAREEFDLVCRELHALAESLDKGRPQQYVNGGKEAGMVLMPVDDKTLFEMRMEAAKVLSKLRLDDMRLSEDKYIRKEELIKRMPEMMSLAYRCFGKLEELIVAKQVRGEDIETRRPPLDYIREMFETGMTTIWSTVKTGR